VEYLKGNLQKWYLFSLQKIPVAFIYKLRVCALSINADSHIIISSIKLRELRAFSKCAGSFAGLQEAGKRHR
jgi:hypothetical protein